MMDEINVRPATPADRLMIRHLAKTFSNQIGFVPGAGLDWYVENHHVLIVEQNDTPAGYMLGRPSMRFDRRIRGVTQTAIFMDAQRKHLGKALVDTYCLTSQIAGRKCVQAWCANDIDAMKFWPEAGFHAIAERTPDNARGRTLTLWRKSLQAERIDTFFTPPPVAGFRAGKIDNVQTLII